MDTILKTVANCTFLTALCLSTITAPAHGQNAEIYVIEAGTDPESAGGGPTILDITDRLGEQLAIEIFVRQIGPNPLTPIRGVAADFPCIAEGGSSGSVEFVRGAVFVNGFRPDWLWFRSLVHGRADESQCPDGNVRFGAATNVGDMDITGAGPKYFGESVLTISADASGTFLIPLIGGSGVVDKESQPIPAFLRTLILTNRPCDFGPRLGDIAGAGGTCGPNGEVTLTDILAILNGFKGDFAEGCELINLDMAGEDGVCAPNGTVDLFDIFAVLDAFQGLHSCCVL